MMNDYLPGKGWHWVLLKIPHGGNSWKWMFTD